MKTSSKSRLIRDGRREDAPELRSERKADPDDRAPGARARGHARQQPDRRPVRPAFFKTDFWFMWCTTFAFQPWHSAVEFKRYLVRFAHMVGGFDRLQGIMRTVYNQYDSLVRPLQKWLDERGVVFEMNTTVTDSALRRHGGRQDRRAASSLSAAAEAGEIAVRPDRPCSGHLGLDDRGVEPGIDGHAPPSLNGQGRRRSLDTLGDDRVRAAGVRQSRRLRRSYRPIEMDLVHHDAARSDAFAHRPRSHRQCARRRRLDHVPAIELARLDRHSAPAAFHRAARRRRASCGATACLSTSQAISSRSRCRPAPAGRS